MYTLNIVQRILRISEKESFYVFIKTTLSLGIKNVILLSFRIQLFTLIAKPLIIIDDNITYTHLHG